MAGKRSRVHPQYKTKYRIRNWSTYDRSLVQRGNITLWFTPDAIAAWTPATTGKRGAQAKYSDLAIEVALTVRLVYGLALRQTEGFLQSISTLLDLGLRIPDNTTLSRRLKDLNVQIRSSVKDRPVDIMIDGTGLRVLSDNVPGSSPVHPENSCSTQIPVYLAKPDACSIEGRTLMRQSCTLNIVIEHRSRRSSRTRLSQ